MTVHRAGMLVLIGGGLIEIFKADSAVLAALIAFVTLSAQALWGLLFVGIDLLSRFWTK